MILAEPQSCLDFFSCSLCSPHDPEPCHQHDLLVQFTCGMSWVPRNSASYCGRNSASQSQPDLVERRINVAPPAYTIFDLLLHFAVPRPQPHHHESPHYSHYCSGVALLDCLLHRHREIFPASGSLRADDNCLFEPDFTIVSKIFTWLKNRQGLAQF